LATWARVARRRVPRLLGASIVAVLGLWLIVSPA
jgi:hypothetical protein